MATAQMSVMHNDYLFDGNVVVSGTFVFPPATLTDAAFAATAGLSTTKQVHRFVRGETDNVGTVAAAVTKIIHIARASGIILSLQAALQVVCAATETVHVDVQRSTAGGAFATVCSATVSFATGDAVRVAKSATLNGALTSFIAGDIFVIVVTVTNSSTAAGLGVTLTLDENAQ